MPPAIRYASSGGVSVACMAYGDGPVDLLFVHAGASQPESEFDLAAFWATLDRFARYGCVLSFDRRWGLDAVAAA